MIFIPRQITAGFQKRGGTVDGQLSFVVYTDEKGVLRKQTSFDHWRDKKIDTITFDNVPVTGLMLNYANRNPWGNGWNDRMAFIRVYDPRGMEFEVDAEILVYMLKTGGYSVEEGFGEVVYAWDGTRMLLLATSSKDYKDIVAESEIVHKSEWVTVPELVVGNVYVRKTGVREIYVGRFEAWTEYRSWTREEQKPRGLMHVFRSEHGGFTVTKSISKRYLHDEGPVQDWERFKGWSAEPKSFEDILEEWERSSEHYILDRSLDKNIYHDASYFAKSDGYYGRSFLHNGNKYEVSYHSDVDRLTVHKNGDYGYYGGYNYRTGRYEKPTPVYYTPEELVAEFKPYYIQHYLSNGREYIRTP